MYYIDENPFDYLKDDGNIWTRVCKILAKLVPEGEKKMKWSFLTMPFTQQVHILEESLLLVLEVYKNTQTQEH